MMLFRGIQYTAYNEVFVVCEVTFLVEVSDRKMCFLGHQALPRASERCV